jgi:hypothetical protein
MQLARAVRILERLRDGEDPLSGRPLASGPATEPDVVRALYTVLAALPDGVEPPPAADAAERVPVAKPQPSRAGLPWSPAEDESLAAAFDAGQPVAKLAGAFERTAAAIRLRLVKLGRLSAEEVLLRSSRRAGSAPAADEPGGGSAPAPVGTTLQLEETASAAASG